MKQNTFMIEKNNHNNVTKIFLKLISDNTEIYILPCCLIG